MLRGYDGALRQPPRRSMRVDCPSGERQQRFLPLAAPYSGSRFIDR
jgi:hypothetical protein